MQPNVPPPIPSAAPGTDPFWSSLQAQDVKLLNALAILYRIAAGLCALVGLLGLPAALIFFRLQAMDAGPSEGSPTPGQFFGIYGGFALTIVLVHVAVAALLWVAGGWLKRRRHYTVLIVLQVLMLALVPHGTALGAFGLYVLLKPHVKAVFPT